MFNSTTLCPHQAEENAQNGEIRPERTPGARKIQWHRRHIANRGQETAGKTSHTLSAWGILVPLGIGLPAHLLDTAAADVLGKVPQGAVDLNTVFR